MAQRFGYKRYGPDPAAGIEWAGKLTFDRGRVAVDTIVQENPPPVVATAIAGLPEGELKSYGLPKVVKRWAAEDPEAAAEWAITLGEEAAIQAVHDHVSSLPHAPEWEE